MDGISSTKTTWQLFTGNKSRLVLIALVLVLLVGVMTVYLPMGIDWERTYRPAALELLHLQSPYNIGGYYNPPWTLLPILPIAILPASLGRAVFLLMGLLGFAFAAYRLGAKPLAFTAFLLSPPVLHCLLNANIDWMPVMGFVLPPQLGLFFVLVKPQVGFAVAIFWLVEAARKGGWREIVRVFWPVTLAVLISLAVFGLWPLRETTILSEWWNASLWPASIPVGLALIVASLRTRKIQFAMGASPCLSPHVLLHSWSGALAAILTLPAETVVAVIGLWTVVLMRWLG